MDRQLWPHQEHAIDTGIQKIEDGVRSFCITSPTGGGKCLGRDTPVLMYDGSIRPVQDVVNGDLLMGPDSMPRRVVGTTRGDGQLFTVTPTKGMAYVVNEHHILALKFTGGMHRQYCEFKDGTGLIEIPVARYLSVSNTMRHCLKGYRVPVDFSEKEVPLDPYYLGIWLGDGTATSAQITKPDKEIEDAVHAVANEHNCTVTTHIKAMVPHHRIVRKNGTAQANPVVEKLRGLGVIQNKHIPLQYLTNSEHIRMEVLAGLMDTDGSPSRSGFDFISKTEQLSKDVAYLARSLGMSAYITECRKECVNNGVWGTYFRVSINGDCDRVPVRIARKRPHPRMQKKDVLSVGIKVTQSGFGEFFGFELDGDGLFLLGDFTVTHNSKIMTGLCEYAASVDKRVAVFTNRRLLTSQLAKGLSESGIHLGVRAAEFEAWTDLNAPVQVCSTPTEVARVINRRKKAINRLMSEDEAHSTYSLFPAEIVLCDEAHMNASGRMKEIIHEYREKHDSTIIGVTATPLGISSLYSELIVAGNMTSLRACGALVPARCFQPTVWDLSKVYRAKHELPSQDAMEAATRAIWTQHVVGSIFTHWKKINPDGKQSIAFAPGVKESMGMAQEFTSHGVRSAHISGEGMWMDGKEYKGAKQEDRDEVFAMSKAGEIKVIWNRFALREAIDLPWLECLILACPIGSLLSYIQTCGRVLRASPSTGKQSAVIIDHAGSIELHGSPNMDRDQQWIQYFHEDSDKITKDRVNSLRDPENQEPTAITCPKCGAMRKSGPKCINPACGFEHSESVRYILQEHGELVATKESFMPKRKPKLKPDTAKLWERCYWRCKNSKTPKSFNQVRALFIRDHGYSPPQGLPLMPKSPLDWSRKIPDVSYADLIHKPK